MYDIQRINSLLGKVGGFGTTVPWSGCIHEILDDVDKRLGIRTRHGCASAYVVGAKPFPVSEYVGARLARLEAHVSRSKAPKYFWLGAGGEAN